MIDADVHVTPIGDFREHSNSRECWCRPVIIEEDAGGYIVAHNSMDRREHTIEKGILQ